MNRRITPSLRLLFVAITLLGTVGWSASSAANTAGGAVIHNVATLNFDGGTTSAWVDVGVNTVAAAPTISVDQVTLSANSGDTVTYNYTILNNANGGDTFSLNAASLDTNVQGAPGLAVTDALGNVITDHTLGGSVTNQASDASGNVFIPTESETNLAVGDSLVINGTTYLIATLTPGTKALTVGTVTTSEISTKLTLNNPDGTPAAIVAGTIPVGTQIGELGSFKVSVTASSPTVSGTDGSHTVKISGQTTATLGGAAGANITYTTSTADANETVTVVLAPTVQLRKEARNVTKGVASFANTGVTAQSGDTLEYRLTATPNAGSGNATNSVLIDEIPAYTTYVAATTSLNGNPVADIVGTFALSAVNGGLSVGSASGAAGEIVDGESAVVIFRVTVD